MTLTDQDKQNILNDFPDIKLSYEKITHKKVYNSDIILAIPDGIKCFVWFTMFNEKFICLLIELKDEKNKEIKNIKIINTCFSKSLCYGTIFYGTSFNHLNNTFFTIEDIFLYKNINFSRENWRNKFNKVIYMFNNDIKQLSYNKSFIIFGLPPIAYSNEEIGNILNHSVKYKISSVQYYDSSRSNSFISLSIDKFNVKEEVISKEVVSKEVVSKIEKKPRYIVLEVKPDIQNDIYNLYSSENIPCGIACIPDYKTSVMMNNLFRNIKENDNLDKLEESDDEDEFENPNIDKFVYMDKCFKMRCHYNKRFKKWVPIEVVNSINISSYDDVISFIKNITSNYTYRKI